MIGALKEKIELLKPQRNEDDAGGFSIQYQSAGIVAASLEDRLSIRDRTFEEGHRRRRRRFTIRHRSDLIFEMRVVHRGQTFRITDIRDGDSARRFATIEGEEITA